MSKKEKLLGRLRTTPRPKDFTWAEATTLLAAYGFKLHPTGGGSGRMFVHEQTRVKLRLHEPHPEKTLKPYMVDQLLEGLRNAGVIE